MSAEHAGTRKWGKIIRSHTQQQQQHEQPRTQNFPSNLNNPFLVDDQVEERKSNRTDLISV